jgi:hypothetical protein
MNHAFRARCGICFVFHVRLHLAFGLLVACGDATIVSDASPPERMDASSACAPGELACSGTCVEPDKDPENCGACGKSCKSDEVCSKGQCTGRCLSFETACGTACKNLASDLANCGACGKACGTTNGAATCKAGTCTIACNPSFFDCDNDTTNGCEVDLDGDPKNCGRCGHDCLGGTCANGQCQPIVIASGEAQPWVIEVDGTNVYWTNYGDDTIRTCAKNKCVPSTLATNQNTVQTFVQDTNNLYWANYLDGDIQKCAKTGCNNAPTTLASNQPEPMGLAVDGVNVYWTSYTGFGLLQKCAVGGCNGAPSTMATFADPLQFVAADGTNAYFTAQDGVRQCAINNCGNSMVTLSMANTYEIIVDKTNVYWSTHNQVARCPIGGSTPTTMANLYVDALAVDSTDVYWALPNSGMIQKCATGGCNNMPTTIATGQSNPHHVALDASAVYWTSYTGGTVMMLAK